MSTQVNLSVSRDNVEKEDKEEEEDNNNDEEKEEGEKYVDSDESFCEPRQCESTIERSRENI